MITDDLINEAARLMNEQAADYERLQAACGRLAQVLIEGEPAVIEAATRVGESQLLQMRARMVRIIRTLTSFAEARARDSENSSLSPETRSAFESASTELMTKAREFQLTRQRTAALTSSGATFATACIEMCGIQPTTYSAPYARNGESRPWA